MTTLAQDLALSVDPVALLNLAGKDADPWQERALRSRSPRLLLNCSRQSGKGEVASVLAVHRAMTRPQSLTIIGAPGLRQATELAYRVRALARQVQLTASKDNSLELQLENGSRIIHIPGNEATVRGYASVSLLILDEASRVPDELYMAVRPMLAVAEDARVVAMSTPFGRRGWWWDAWANGGRQWERFEVPATECPRISPEFLEEERAALGDFWFRQEYMCEFVDATGALFRQEDIDAAFTAGKGIPAFFDEFPDLRPASR